MRYSKTNDIYKIIRITGSQDNILGIVFGTPTNKKDNIEILEWNFSNSNGDIKRTSKEDVAKEVLFGLDRVNEALRANYVISKIYFSPFDKSDGRVYSYLTIALIKHYHEGKEFIEVQ